MILKVCCCSSPGVCYIGRWVLYRWRHLERPGFVIYGLFYVEVYPSLWYFGHLMQRANSLEKTLMLKKIKGRRRRGWQWTGWMDGITDSMDMNLSKLWEIVENRGDLCAIVHRVTVWHNLLTEQWEPGQPYVIFHNYTNIFIILFWTLLQIR